MNRISLYFTQLVLLVCYIAADDLWVTHEAVLDIAIGDKRAGKITIGLFGDVVPRTVRNFVEICNSDPPDSYQKTIFHRVIKKFMMQGGDFTNFDGTGGKSIYGEKFDDENFDIKTMGTGTVAMANAGPDSNGSQFFIAFGDISYLNGKHVVFGKVVDGMDVVKDVEDVETDKSDKPYDDVTIVNCDARKIPENKVQKLEINNEQTDNEQSEYM